MIQCCPRKAFYKIIQGLEPKVESDALGFGTSIHTFMEHWYTLDKASRTLPDDSQTKNLLNAYSQYHELESHQEGALESLRRSVLKMREKHITTEETDKRSVHNGIKILKGYTKQYANDGLKIYVDSQGPFIERKFSFIIYEDAFIVIEFFGTIDAGLNNEETGTVFIADHKTTAALGVEFFNRLKPNSQYTGYIMAAQRCFNIQTETFMINALQVAKTKQEYARQFTFRTQEDFDELILSVKTIVQQWLSYVDQKQFPMGPVINCSAYGGCTFLDVCSVPSSIRPNVIQSKFKEQIPTGEK